jgi:bisanhydrobacterioruberin hydratase
MDQTSIPVKKLPVVEHTIIYLVVIYTVGMIGMLVPEVNRLFIFLVPVNILLALGVVFLYHSNPSWKFAFTCLIVCLGGFWVEWLGVHTGVIFGAYEYGDGLGVKLLEVPVVMGFNWLLLVYGSTMIVQKYVKNHWVIAGFGATLMVIYDLILEASAIKYGFWKWQNAYIPLQNYAAWFLCSFLFIYFFSRSIGIKEQNRVGIAVFWLQLIFFACILAGNNLT